MSANRNNTTKGRPLPDAAQPHTEPLYKSRSGAESLRHGFRLMADHAGLLFKHGWLPALVFGVVATLAVMMLRTSPMVPLAKRAVYTAFVAPTDTAVLDSMANTGNFVDAMMAMQTVVDEASAAGGLSLMMQEDVSLPATDVALALGALALLVFAAAWMLTAWAWLFQTRQEATGRLEPVPFRLRALPRQWLDALPVFYLLVTLFALEALVLLGGLLLAGGNPYCFLIALPVGFVLLVPFRLAVNAVMYDKAGFVASLRWGWRQGRRHLGSTSVLLFCAGVSIALAFGVMLLPVIILNLSLAEAGEAVLVGDAVDLPESLGWIYAGLSVVLNLLAVMSLITCAAPQFFHHHSMVQPKTEAAEPEA